MQRKAVRGNWRLFKVLTCEIGYSVGQRNFMFVRGFHKLMTVVTM